MARDRLLVNLLPLSLLKDHRGARVALLHVSERLELPLVAKQQPLLRTKLVQLIRLGGGTLENRVVRLASSSRYLALPSLLDVVLHAVFLVNSLIFGDKVHTERAPLQLPAPSLVAVSLGGAQALDQLMPISAVVALHRVALGEADAHDFRRLLAGLGTHLEAP